MQGMDKRPLPYSLFQTFGQINHSKCPNCFQRSHSQRSSIMSGKLDKLWVTTIELSSGHSFFFFFNVGCCFCWQLLNFKDWNIILSKIQRVCALLETGHEEMNKTDTIAALTELDHDSSSKLFWWLHSIIKKNSWTCISDKYIFTCL